MGPWGKISISKGLEENYAEVETLLVTNIRKYGLHDNSNKNTVCFKTKGKNSLALVSR